MSSVGATSTQATAFATMLMTANRANFFLPKSPSLSASFLAPRPTTMPTSVEAMTQLHHGLPPQERSIRVWPMKPIRPPATGPYMPPSMPRMAYCRLMLVLGMPLGMATKRPSTKNRAAPRPTATTVLMEEFFMSMHSSQNLKVGCGRGRLLRGCRARPCILPSDTRRENQNDALFVDNARGLAQRNAPGNAGADVVRLRKTDLVDRDGDAVERVDVE